MHFKVTYCTKIFHRHDVQLPNSQGTWNTASHNDHC